jgi:mitochondrial fission protein ELM1
MITYFIVWLGAVGLLFEAVQTQKPVLALAAMLVAIGNFAAFVRKESA